MQYKSVIYRCDVIVQVVGDHLGSGLRVILGFRFRIRSRFVRLSVITMLSLMSSSFWHL